MSAARLALEAVRWGAGAWLLWRVPTCAGGGGRHGAALPGGRSDAGAGAQREAGRQGGLGEGVAESGAPAPLSSPSSGATVVVPARDEEDNLPRLLASLAAQDPPPAQVIVVDDGSADATASVARRAGATVVAGGPLPAGWTGKSWACATGAEAAGPGTLVFLDADTWLAPGGLRCILGEHRRRGGLVSVQPFHATGRPYEALSAFFNLVSMMGVGTFTPRAARPTAAFGPCLVCSATDYVEAGGHGHPEVRGRVVEDVALARRFAEAGLPVTVLGGRGTVAFRMYPEGLRQLVEGWTKNFAAGAASTRPATFVLISLWLSGCISAAWWLPAPAAAGVYLAYGGQLAWMLRRIGRFGRWPVLLYPVPLAFFLAVFARSLVLTHVRGEVRWRGRTISTRATRSTRSARP